MAEPKRVPTPEDPVEITTAICQPVVGVSGHGLQPEHTFYNSHGLRNNSPVVGVFSGLPAGQPAAGQPRTSEGASQEETKKIKQTLLSEQQKQQPNCSTFPDPVRVAFSP